ncbi:MAG TPA: response regulator transcription factor [Firmicutes bacterium]|nr:response regulator transcription factor [Bacillota bacterium]
MNREKKSILIIDDEEDILKLCKIVLEKEGFNVHTTNAAKDGIEIATTIIPDLVLLDIMMPVMDGWEVLKILRAEKTTAKIPVAMLTAKTDFKDKIMGIQEGAIDYISKPFLPQELIFRVKRIFQELN